MKKFSRISIIVIFIVVGLVVFLTQTEAASVGPAACSVSPASGSIAQGGEISFVVSSDVPSSSSDYVYVSATNFSNGLYSDLGPGKIIPVGSTSVNFKVYAQSFAEIGSQTFKVNCSTGCPVGGCPGGTSPDILGTATVSLNVTGEETGGGVSSADCSIPNVSLSPDSSFIIKFKTPASASSINNGTIKLSGSSSPEISVSPVHSSIKITDGFWYGTTEVLIKTGPNFSGGNYSVTSDIAGSKCTAKGNATLPAFSNPSGVLRFIQVKSLNGTMFPESGCSEKGFRAPCRRYFYGMSGPQVMDYVNPPVLIGGDIMRFHNKEDADITVKTFSLADPMNPTYTASGVTMRPSEDSRGEHGQMHAVAVATSQDGRYSVMASDQGSFFVKTPSKTKTKLADYILGGPLSIVKSGSDYILLHDKGAVNITNPVVDDGDFVYESLPSDFPDFNRSKFSGPKVVVGDGSYVAVSASDILLFSLSEEEPIAKLDIPSEHEKISFSPNCSIKIPFSGGDYIFSRCGSVNIFKFEYSFPKITWVAKDVPLPPYDRTTGSILGFKQTGFDAGNGNIGIITFGGDRVRAFLFSDLASGKWIDTLANSPTDTNMNPGYSSAINGERESGSLGSFSKNGITYVYSGGNMGQNIKVWKFESNVTGGGSGSGSGGSGIPYYPTPPTQTSVAGCPGGTVYQTSAGALCVSSSGGVTTTTTFNFDDTVVQAGCFGWNAYSTSTGEKCLQANSKKIEFMGPPTTEPTLKQGSTGEAVKELQRFLNEKLNLGLTVDGKMGPATVAAVKQWQDESGLTSDGVVGPKTRATMNMI